MDEKIEKYIGYHFAPVTQRNIKAELKPLISFGSVLRWKYQFSCLTAKCYAFIKHSMNFLRCAGVVR
jgi:hypothetical protein